MDELILSAEQYLEMVIHVERCAPDEACGLIAGIGNRTERVYLVTNQYHSPVRFRMDAKEQVTAMMDIEQNSWEMLAIYHSHPRGPSYPSSTDLSEFAFPGSLYLIWHPLIDQWHCRAYRIDNGEYQEVKILLLE